MTRRRSTLRATCCSEWAWVSGYRTIRSTYPEVSSKEWRLARAFVLRPPLLLADEPTGSLDARTGEAVIELMFQLNRERGSTLLLVTHDPDIARRCARQIELHAGRVVAGDVAVSA